MQQDEERSSLETASTRIMLPVPKLKDTLLTCAGSPERPSTINPFAPRPYPAAGAARASVNPFGQRASAVRPPADGNSAAPHIATAQAHPEARATVNLFGRGPVRWQYDEQEMQAIQLMVLRVLGIGPAPGQMPHFPLIPIPNEIWHAYVIGLVLDGRAGQRFGLAWGPRPLPRIGGLQMDTPLPDDPEVAFTFGLGQGFLAGFHLGRAAGGHGQ